MQDGTVRVWDCSSYSCLHIMHPSPVPSRDDPGPLIPLDQPSQLLNCVRSPGNLCVRFDSGGNWLLIGTADGHLVLWNCRLNAAVLHTQCTKSSSSVAVVPQVR
jgi:WD40 repeat protein